MQYLVRFEAAAAACRFILDSLLHRAARLSARWNLGAKDRAALVMAATLFLAPAAYADSTGEQSPTSTTGTYTNATNALVCDNVVADATVNNQAQVFQDFGLSLPGNAIITGVQVRVRANDGTKTNRKFQVTLSWDGGATYTSGTAGVLQTSNFRRNSPLRDYIVGGSAVTWGRTWSAAEFTNANFRVKTIARLPGPNPASDPAHLDCIPVTVFYRIPGAPNLSVSKIDSPDPVQPDSPITYTLSYGNTGESTATNVLVSDTVPANTTFVSATPTPVSAPAVGGTGTVTWNVGSVAFGDSGLVTMVVKTNPSLANGTQITNSSYSIESDQNTPTSGNAVVTTVQGTIALSLSKQGTPDPVAPGGTLIYLLTVHNGGNALSTNIYVNEAYDFNTTYSSYTSTCGGISKLADDQWQIPSLAAGATCTLTIDVTVASPLADGVLLTNTADIFDDANNAAQASALNQIRNPAVCGDGIVTTPEEECDEGVDNGTAGSCCTASCAFRAAGQACRPATGECDIAETCDGASATCPADAFVTAGMECAGDGNVCTDDECDDGGTCGHPANTSPCDDGVFCNGADTCSGGTCSGHEGDPCAGGSECNDSCNETADNCAVSAGTACAPDANVCTNDECNGSGACAHPNNSVPCDDGAFCNGADTCSGGSCSVHGGDPCAGGPECDDTCNEGSDDCAVSAGTACTDEGNVCTDDACDGAGACRHTNNTIACNDGSVCSVNDVCSNGTCAGTSVQCGDGVFQPSCAEECDDGNTLPGDGCSSDCKLEPCGPEPEVGCAEPAVAQAAILGLSNSSTDAKDRVIWKWSKGSETLQGDFGNPLTTDDYQFCIYRATAPMLLMSLAAPAGGTCDGKPCWKESSSGFRYKDKGGTPNGVTGIALKAGAAQAALIKLKGLGIDLPMFDLTEISAPLVVQLRNMGTGKCWEAVYSAPALKSSQTKFKDRAD